MSSTVVLGLFVLLLYNTFAALHHLHRRILLLACWIILLSPFHLLLVERW